MVAYNQIEVDGEISRFHDSKHLTCQYQTNGLPSVENLLADK